MSSQLFDSDLITRFRTRALAKSEIGAPDFLLTLVEEDLLDRLSLIKKDFAVCLNYGAHNGSLSRALSRLPHIGLVISSERALALTAALPHPCLVIDEAPFALKEEALDLIISPLHLQWVNDIPLALRQIRSALKADGVFIGATLGASSLQELRSTLIEAETEMFGGISPRVAPFIDVRDMGQLLQSCGFALPVTDRDVLKVRYKSALHLMRDLRAMGASNALMERAKTPLTRRFFQRVDEIYAEKHSEPDGRIFATFEIVYFLGWAPHPDQPRPLRPGSGQVSLTQIFKTD